MRATHFITMSANGSRSHVHKLHPLGGLHRIEGPPDPPKRKCSCGKKKTPTKGSTMTAQEKQDHTHLVFRLAKHPHCAFSRDELARKPLPELRKLEQMATGTAGRADLGFTVNDWWKKPEEGEDVDPLLGFKVEDL